jgi:hypothetical protein
MCKRHRSEPPGKFRPVRLLPNQIPQQSQVILHSETIACTTPDKPNIANAIESSVRHWIVVVSAVSAEVVAVGDCGFRVVVGARDAEHIGKVYEGFCCQRMPAAASL